MDQTGKELLTSKTFWGQVVTVFGMLLGAFGIHINVSLTASVIVMVMGIVLNVVGNLNRKGPITSVFGISTPAGKRKQAANDPTSQSTSTSGPSKDTAASAPQQPGAPATSGSPAA